MWQCMCVGRSSNSRLCIKHVTDTMNNIVILSCFHIILISGANGICFPIIVVYLFLVVFAVYGLIHEIRILFIIAMSGLFPVMVFYLLVYGCLGILCVFVIFSVTDCSVCVCVSLLWLRVYIYVCILFF